MAGAAELTDAIIKQGRRRARASSTCCGPGDRITPYELYKKAGIDMATPAPYRALVARMNRLMDEVEALENSPDKAQGKAKGKAK